MLANGTILGVAPIWKTMLLAGGLLTALFIAIEPESSLQLSLLPRTLFWILHVSCALTGIILASYAVRILAKQHLSLFMTVTLTGLIGAILTTPPYWALETLFPSNPPDGWLDEFETRGLWQAMLAEFLEMLPTFLISWYAVNLPLFLNPTLLNNGLPPDEPPAPDKDQDDKEQTLNQLYERLPEVIGKDIVAISSDLHYLNIHTTLGRTLLLGNLKDYADAFGNAGMLVHRSHWVAKAHVVKLHITGKTAYCLMSSGLKIPISRAKRKEAKTYFGEARLSKNKEQNRLVRIK